MTDTVYFYNDGELDIRGATTMGVHVKEGVNPIGLFGTGLKFAIATLLRTNHEVIIFCGSKRHVFHTTKTTIRDVEFDLVCMDGKELGFTTQTGKNWEVWMAYRELRCNAMDEQNAIISDSVAEVPEPAPGTTLIVVKGEGIVRAHKQRTLYFCEERLELFSLPGVGQILAGGSDQVFYRGVAAYQLTEPSLFTYNIWETCPLTEDRTLKEGYWIPYIMGKIIGACTIPDVIERTVNAPEKTVERGIQFSSCTPSTEFIDVLSANRSNSQVSKSARDVWVKNTKIGTQYVFETPAGEEIPILQAAIKLCEQIDISFNVNVDDVMVSTTLGPNVEGMMEGGIIYLTRSCILDGGIRKTTAVLFEEWVHRDLKFQDMTRSMQNYLFDKIAALVDK